MTRNHSPPNPRKVPKPSPEELESQPDDARSIAESERLETLKDIEHEGETNKFRRSEKFRDLFWGGMRWLVGTIIVMTITVVVVVAFHHLVPESWSWLTKDQLSDLRIFLFSAAVISTVTSHLQRNL